MKGSGKKVCTKTIDRRRGKQVYKMKKGISGNCARGSHSDCFNLLCNCKICISNGTH